MKTVTGERFEEAREAYWAAVNEIIDAISWQAPSEAKHELYQDAVNKGAALEQLRAQKDTQDRMNAALEPTELRDWA